MSISERTVIVADDHALVRDALKDILLNIGGVSVIGEAKNGLEAIALTKSLKPDLLTLDSAMPLAEGMEVYGEIRRWGPDTRIAVVTGFTSVNHLSDWIAVGVEGLFLKTCPTSQLTEGFSMILNGGSFFSEAVKSSIADAPEKASLTLRERQVMQLVADGLSNKEIAQKFSISPKTVDNHRCHLMAKLGVSSTGHLIAYALKEGLLDLKKQL
ncbi:MAG: response regulator transcription factor [Gammaproteobacteria bacterium]|nr:response regulator transcription factor [Gammaproteobacteria bacterium]